MCKNRPQRTGLRNGLSRPWEYELKNYHKYADRVELNVLRTHWICLVAQQTFSFIDLRVGMYRIGQGRCWWETSFLHQRFTIKGPSEIEARYLPLTHVNVIHKPEGGMTIRDVRHAVREDLVVESVLRQVSA